MRASLAIGTMLLAGCAAQRLEKEHAHWLGAFGTMAPPGTLPIGNGLYYDETEVTNFYWLEYEYWVRTVMDSAAVVGTLPDTTVWVRPKHYGEPMVDYYLRHPAYKDYPVVGVTYDQALAYSKWRGDRVMESWLVWAGIITRRKDQTMDDHFTIEGFYATDSLKAYHHLPYPSYALPNYAEWRIAVGVADSLARVNLPRCKKFKSSEFRGARFTECSDVVRDGRFKINSNDVSGGDPVAPTNCERCERPLIWQLRGNVAELSADSTLSLGGGWTDRLDSILLDQPFPNHAPNAATGFRNVCRWRKWDGVRH